MFEDHGSVGQQQLESVEVCVVYVTSRAHRNYATLCWPRENWPGLSLDTAARELALTLMGAMALLLTIGESEPTLRAWA